MYLTSAIVKNNDTISRDYGNHSEHTLPNIKNYLKTHQNPQNSQNPHLSSKPSKTLKKYSKLFGWWVVT